MARVIDLLRENASYYAADLHHYHTTKTFSIDPSLPDYNHPAWDLPSNILITYYDERDTSNRTTYFSLIERLDEIRFDLHCCYKYIELLYGVPENLPWRPNRVERCLAFNQQYHPPLRRDKEIPAYYVDVLPKLYWAQQVANKELARIEAAVDRYESNLGLLYDAFIWKWKSYMEKFGDERRVADRMGRWVMEAGMELHEIVEEIENRYEDEDEDSAMLDEDDEVILEDEEEEEEIDDNENRLSKALGELRTFWRRYGGKDDRAPIEDVWEWIAGKELILD